RRGDAVRRDRGRPLPAPGRRGHGRNARPGGPRPGGAGRAKVRSPAGGGLPDGGDAAAAAPRARRRRGRPGARRAPAGPPPAHAGAPPTVGAARLPGAPGTATRTRTGYRSRLVSSSRPPAPILGVSNQPRTYRQLALVWGVHPVLCLTEASFESLLACAREYL